MCYTFVIKVFVREIAETVATDLSDERRVESATLRPHRDVRCTATGREHHFAERVTTLQQLVVRANEHVPCKVADDAQTHEITLTARENATVG
jgi:hypothetical protein